MARAALRMALAIGLAAAAATPAAAQLMSEGYEFLEAVRERDGTKVTNALQQPGSVIVNARDIASGETALHIVTARRDAVWIRFLTQNGANPNVRDKEGNSPLSIAVGLGFVEGAEDLIKAGARIDETNSTGETPLISAIPRRSRNRSACRSAPPGAGGSWRRTGRRPRACRARDRPRRRSA